MKEVGNLFAVNGQMTGSVGLTNPAQKTVGGTMFGDVMKQMNQFQTHQFTQYADSKAGQLVKNQSNSFQSAGSMEYEKNSYKQTRIETVSDKCAQTDTVSKDVVKDVLEDFAHDVKETLKEELGVSEEQIENAMETLGLAYTDLLVQNQLANLVAELTDVQGMESLLCSEEFVSVLTQVRELGQSLQDTLGMNVGQLQNAELGFAAEQVQQTEFEQLLTAQAQTETISQEQPQADLIEVLTDAPEILQETTAVNGSSTDTPQEAVVTDGLNMADVPQEAENQIDNLQETLQKTESPELTAVLSQETQKLNTQKVNTAETQENSENVLSFEEVPEEENIGEEVVLQNTDADESAEDDAGTNKQQTGAQNKNLFSKEMTPSANEAIVLPQNQNGVQTPQMQTSTSFVSSVDTQDIIRQIVQSAKVISAGDMTTMEMQLNPENLGKIYLKVTQEESAVTAKIMAQNSIVKEAIEAQIVELKQNLEQAGVKVDAVEVTIASHEFEQNLEQNAKQEQNNAQEQEKAQGGVRRLRFDDLSTLSGIMSEEEALAARIMADNGNSIDYTA